MPELLPITASLTNGPPCPQCNLKLDPAAKEPPVWWCGYCYIYFNQDLSVLRRGAKSVKAEPKAVAPKFDDNGFAFDAVDES